MSIQKSSSWKENGKLEDFEDDYEFPSYDNDKNSIEDDEIVLDAPSSGSDYEPLDEPNPPLFNTNFYLDDEMYEGYKSEGSSKLQYLSTTSEKEDNLYVKLSLTFMLTLLLCGIVSSFIYKETKGVNPISIWISIGTTMSYWFMLKRKNN